MRDLNLQQFSCLSLLSAEIIGGSYHTQIKICSDLGFCFFEAGSCHAALNGLELAM